MFSTFKYGNTALHIAAEADDQAIATLLLDNECDQNIRNKHGKKPSEVAIGFEMTQLLKDYESRLPGLPIEVKKLDKNSAHIFSSLLGEESYLHFESRVMLAGEQGTGKTTIARHLVGKQPTRYRKSTDGIELYNGLSYFDRETKEWLGGQQDFSLEEITVCRSLLRADVTTQKQHVPSADTTPTSPNISDVTEEASMSANEEWLKQKSNESKLCNETLSTEYVMTEAVKAKKLPEPQFQTVPGCANSLAISMEKKLPGHVAVQKEREDNDDIYESDEKGVIRSLERQSVISEFDGESSDTRNDLVVLDYTTESQTSDITKYRQIHEPSFDEYKPMEDSLDASLKSGFTSDLHINTVTKPGIIARLKRVFGITKQVKEVKISITKKSFLEKSSKVGKKKLHNRKIAPIIIWDFGGQDVFYSTHQTFLTYRAIYIIVLDGSRKLDDPCQYEQYLPGKSGHKTSRDGTLLTYDRWGIDQPMNTKTYRCVRLSKDLREFESDECDTKRNFLCSDNGAELSSQPTSEPLITEILKSKPTIKHSTENDISSTPRTTEKITFPPVTTHKTDVSSAGLSSQPKSEPTVKQSTSTQTSTDDITSLSPLGLQTSENDISSTPMTTENEMVPLVSTQRTDVSSMDKNTVHCF
ncbi:Hypothetical predicted protein [Mytilus galloprovincialis]|uniref:Uncharacterized protein n=1 Tax=Mytilus galloprovincialis TaxID=29158 RepID=A0A8B6GYA6_MYTGA|nr:Hypothetical predicted protein [Mytilus galloprovincialis]